jgi:hypothetical protein
MFVEFSGFFAWKALSIGFAFLSIVSPVVKLLMSVNWVEMRDQV